MKKMLLVLLTALSLCGCNSSPSGSDTVDIESINGNVYYRVYENENSTYEARVPDVELPYTYNIPNYVRPVIGSYFGMFAIRDSELYSQYVDLEIKDNVATYTLKENEWPITKINNRYFARGGEFIFDKNGLFMYSGELYATREYIDKNNIPIFNIESQHKSWVINGAQTELYNQLYEIIRNITPNNRTASLPNNIVLNNKNPHVEVNVSYEAVYYEEDWELNGYELTLKSNSQPECTLRYTCEYDGYRENNIIRF